MGISGRIAEYFLRNSLTPLIALIALLLGVGATLVTPREEEPQINVTMANVFVPFPGASARDVEALVTRPAEQVLSRIAGIEHVYSVSRPGMAVITVQYQVGEDPIQALVRLYDTVNSHRDWLSPSLGVMEPIIKPKGIDDVPIVTLTFHSTDPLKSAFEMQQVARAIEIDLKRIPGTRDVATIGGPGHVIRVVMDADRMNAHGITAQDLKAALQVSNASQPAGSLVTGNRELLVQTGTYIESAADVKRLVVGVFDRKPVYLADVAQVVDGADQPLRYVWHGDRKAEFPAVTLSVSKKPGVNAADVAEAVIARAEALKGTVIPEGVEFSVTRNYGATATDKAQKLIGKLVFATAFVVLLVLFALGKREAVIVGAAVTLTLAATLFASWAWGFTLNRVSLFALIFSIGILVDDAIVVVENIHRWHLLQPDKPLWQIIPPAVDEVGGPTILATFTVIAALLPMAFVSGLMGPYMSPIPINASMGMFISLAIAFVITPWLALKLMKPAAHGGAAGHGEDRLAAKLDGFFRRIMTPLLDPATGAAARRKLWIGILAAILVSVSLGFVKLVVLKMLPFDNKSEFQIVLDMPIGTPLEETAKVLREISAEIAQVEEVADYQAYAGTASPINFNGLVRQYYLRSAPEMGDIQVNLVDKKHRSRQSHEIAVSVRDRIVAVALKHGGNAKVVEVPPGPPVMSPIVAEIYGPDYAGQIAVAKQVRAAFEGTQDIVGVDDTVDEDAEKLVLRVAQAKAALLGVAQKDIVDVVRMGLSGEDVTPVHDGDAKYEIPVRIVLPAERQNSIDQLLKLKVRARDGALVPVSEVVEIKRTLREKVIYHKDLLPVVFVTGDMGGKLDSPLYGMFDIRSKLAGISLPQGGTLGEYFFKQPKDPYAQYSLKWDGEWQVTYETFRDMGAAYAVGLVLIYLLVVAQFKSYLVPLIIMAPIPLTIIGVMPGHALFGAQYTATSMIGMIALAGIIVRNSILLVDFINEQVADGMDFAEAVIQAAAIRAKPIVLTGMAAMLGALFIVDDPIFAGLALSLIFGIFVSTALTLVVIPVLYYAVMKDRIAQPR
ncbi:efflux RND transporter permease subunit [Sulfuritalea hydrogenivorans]|uniref:Acriflavin resistance protein n=1 Tax=Sulfuritalea hydrogenivorans sk43H TaxID=1223802 RepID=W0SJ15_9PROT|nr:efflux RND transporter permease subunit [Sulfuritalea hydrogenivorans]MDK9714282.1 efflux RND transporter permease subunit [Sulfuritalea sp.]BAO30666.1 acriflavin resistance protein [Sulfuritalea hydrogenivorans sk43H]